MFLKFKGRRRRGTRSLQMPGSAFERDEVLGGRDRGPCDSSMGTRHGAFLLPRMPTHSQGEPHREQG